MRLLTESEFSKNFLMRCGDFYNGVINGEIDTSEFRVSDCSVRYEGYVLDKDNRKHYVEARVKVIAFEVGEHPYDDDFGYEDDWDFDDEEEVEN